MIIEIKSLKTSIICEIPDKLLVIWKHNYFWSEYIPNVTIDVSNKKPQLYIKLGKKFLWKKHLITTTNSENDLRSIIVIIGSLLERKRQKKRLYQVHGSAVSIDEKAIALIGGISGIGKTTLAVNLSKYKNAKFIGDEKFILNGKTRTIDASCPLSLDNNKTNQKINFNIHTTKIPLKLIVFPIITKELKLTIYKYDKLKTFWHLYEETSRDIRNLNMLYDNFTKNYKSFDTNKIMSQRLMDISIISNSTPAYFIRGTIKKIKDFIYNLITSST